MTEELAGYGNSGGIGAAMLELASALSRAGAFVEIFHIPSAPLPPAQNEKMAVQCAAMGLTLRMIDPSDFVWGEAGPEKRSYSVYCTLLALRDPLDVVHFHDYRGLGFYAQNAKRQGLAFSGTRMVVQVHGPTRWALEANRVLFSQVSSSRRISWSAGRSKRQTGSSPRAIICWIGCAGTISLYRRRSAFVSSPTPALWLPRRPCAAGGKTVLGSLRALPPSRSRR